MVQREAKQEAVAPTSGAFACLVDELVLEILSRTDLQTKDVCFAPSGTAHMPLVCKRFKVLLAKPTCVWHSIKLRTVDDSRLQGLLNAWLVERGKAVQHLEVNNYGWPLKPHHLQFFRFLVPGAGFERGQVARTLSRATLLSRAFADAQVYWHRHAGRPRPAFAARHATRSQSQQTLGNLQQLNLMLPTRGFGCQVATVLVGDRSIISQ
ncbi:hypothetical protein WJX72_001782 [[Myrmecia] bisecta]|uniref:F-box domain-containing protein n=1 Tax=[Myrmecia] bisecta TaxID=41462 RepID=A0AAW1PKV0_9CHLO